MLPERQGPPAANRRASSGVSDDHHRVPVPGDMLAELVEHIDHFQRRVLLDAVLDAWASHWERRARALEAARPVPGDYTGQATREQLSAQWQRLTVAAAACRARAQVSPLELVEPAVDAVLSEVA